MKTADFTMNYRKSFKAIALLVILSIVLSWVVYSETGKRFEAGTAVSPEPAATYTEDLIRFHVVANSDAEEDQALKRAVRDAVLRRISPALAVARSLEESRQILLALRPEMEEIAREVVAAWGHDDPVSSEYGYFQFPTKAYGSLVLPAGDYEALRILIGKAEGSNWWCVLFPPLCIIDVDQTSDNRAGNSSDESLTNAFAGSRVEERRVEEKQEEKSFKKVKFYFWEKIKGLKG